MSEIPMSAQMLVADLLRDYRPGSYDWSWEQEFEDIRRRFAGPELADLAESLCDRGMQEPILLGNDGRVWDGHKRLSIAHYYGWLEVPISRASEACDHNVRVIYPGSAIDVGGYWCDKCEAHREGGRMAHDADGSMWWESLDWNGNVIHRSWRGGPFETRPAPPTHPTRDD